MASGSHGCCVCDKCKFCNPLNADRTHHQHAHGLARLQHLAVGPHEHRVAERARLPQAPLHQQQTLPRRLRRGSVGVLEQCTHWSAYVAATGKLFAMATSPVVGWMVSQKPSTELAFVGERSTTVSRAVTVRSHTDTCTDVSASA